MDTERRRPTTPDVAEAVAAVKQQLGVASAPANTIAGLLPEELRGPFWEQCIERYLASELARADVFADLVTRMRKAQQAHLFADTSTCQCGFKPATGDDWERHQLAVALRAILPDGSSVEIA